MATGDILSIELRSAVTMGIATDGWILVATIEGAVDGGTYDFGLGSNNEPDNAKINGSVTTNIYTSAASATTATKTFVGTRVLRKAYPNDTVLWEIETGGNLEVYIALSDFIYTAESALSVTISAGWHTNDGAGGGSETTTLTTDSTITNNSGIAYRTCFGYWDYSGGTLTHERVKSDFDVAFQGRHRDGIAAIKFTATGQTSTHTQTATVSTQTSVLRTGSGLFAPTHKTTIPITGFTQGEDIKIRAQVYPNIGVSGNVLDTDTFTDVQEECLGRNSYIIVCDKNDSIDVNKFVSTTGNDTTGDGTIGTPYLTIGKALEDGATNIKCATGTYEYLGKAIAQRTSTGYWRTIEPDGSGTVTMELNPTYKEYKTPHLKILNCNMASATTASFLIGGGINRIAFVGCTRVAAVGAHTAGLAYQSIVNYEINCSGDASGWKSLFFSDRNRSVWEGNDYDNLDGIQRVYRTLGCHLRGGNLRFVLSTHASNLNPDNVNYCYDYSKIMEQTGSTGGGTIDPYDDINFNNGDGISAIGTVLERTVSVPALARISSDDSTNSIAHAIIAFCTIVGERGNFGYNDHGTEASPQLGYKFLGNFDEEWNCKTDRYNHAVDGPNGLRTGCWPVSYNVGSIGNVRQQSAQNGDFDGLNAVVGTRPVFIDDQSLAVAGSGNGDYHLDETTTVGLNWIPSGANNISPYDIDGVARRDDGTGAAGAFEFPLAPTQEGFTLRGRYDNLDIRTRY